jgi:uncharacterized protein YxjI
VARRWGARLVPHPDTYGVEVAPGEDDALMICIAVCLDRIHHDEEQRRR